MLLTDFCCRQNQPLPFPYEDASRCSLDCLSQAPPLDARAMCPESPENLATLAQISALYDRFGGWLDTQAFYKDPAIDELFSHADFERARFVYELGCGTGRLAERILASNDHVIYQGVDTAQRWPDFRRVG